MMNRFSQGAITGKLAMPVFPLREFQVNAS